MPKDSAGLLVWRRRAAGPEVLLVHPGGPFWRAKDDGAWSIPKGEPDPGEDLLAAARRELTEETGAAPEGPFVPLPPVRQKGGKVVHAWAVEADVPDPESAGTLRSNTFTMEWPPRSGRMQAFPEVDRAAWFDLDTARRKLNPAQTPLLDALSAPR
jgi:predicted NUDIX family NTP pyrophosphohydrolase